MGARSTFSKPVLKRKTESGSLVVLPEYYRLDKNEKSRNNTGKWVAVDPKEVPAETGLDKLSFKRPKNDRPTVSRVTPDDADSCWKKPGRLRIPTE